MTTISASSTIGIYLTSSSYANPVVINRGITISGTQNAVSGSNQAWTLVNNGSIVGSSLYNGVYFGDGGLVTNAASAFISGGNGIHVNGGIGTVINNGSIAGSSLSSIGIYLGAGGAVTNQSGGTISGYTGVQLAAGGAVTNAATASITGVYEGVLVSGGTGTVVNHGHITGTSAEGFGVELGAGGTITNAASASIAGGIGGVDISGTGTLVNYGSIAGTGPGGSGVVLSSGGSITNAASASIYGNGQGVYLFDGTLTNAGTINGANGTAVAFGGTGNDLLVLAPGYKLTGIASGGAGASNTLELASAASTGTLSGLGTEFVGFNQITIASKAVWQLAGANTLASGVTITNSGTLMPIDATLTGNGVLINDGSIAIDPGTLAVGSLIGTGSVAIDTGSMLHMQGAAGSGETIGFTGGGGTLNIGKIASFQAIINGVTAGDKIIVDTTTAATFSQNGSVVSVIANGATLGQVDFASAAQATTASTSNILVDQMICFCKGTLITTPDGEIPIENLRHGDRVLTQSGRERPIVWIGTGRVLATRGRRNAATPVIIRKGALADNVPHHDLRVTKGHSFCIDDVLIPVEFLVNHRSILWDDRAQEVELYHIELESHDVLLANGAPAESYRDDGNRWLFRNANEGWDQPAKEPCAPVLTGGPIVDAVWRRLLDRAGPRPGLPLTDDPDLCLLVDGEQIKATSQHGVAHCFTLSTRPGSVRVASRAGSPAELGVARDSRMLGVALRRIAVRRRARFRLIEASDPRLEEGFYAFETDCGLRWTDGDARLPAALFDGFDGPMELVLHVGATTQYPAYGAAASRSAA